jgi:hypothetical protein
VSLFYAEAQIIEASEGHVPDDLHLGCMFWGLVAAGAATWLACLPRRMTKNNEEQ